MTPGSAINLRRFGALAGIVGPILPTLYFAVPAYAGWQYAGAPPAHLILHADAHQVLFIAGAWLQATGVVFSVLFFLNLLSLSGARAIFAGLVTPVAAALLLSVVLIDVRSVTYKCRKHDGHVSIGGNH